MMLKYILDGTTPVPCNNSMKWGLFMGDVRARRVAYDTTLSGVEVSTVFLGFDHNFGGGPPLLFETMIFGGEFADYQARCSTWEEAEAQHAAAVVMVEGCIGSEGVVMRLWLVSRTDRVGYDEYDAAVVAAPTETDARNTYPGDDGSLPYKWDGTRWWFARPEFGDGWSDHSSWPAPDKLVVQELGKAVSTQKAGVVLASFNAG